MGGAGRGFARGSSAVDVGPGYAYCLQWIWHSATLGKADRRTPTMGAQRRCAAFVGTGEGRLALSLHVYRAGSVTGRVGKDHPNLRPGRLTIFHDCLLHCLEVVCYTTGRADVCALTINDAVGVKNVSKYCLVSIYRAIGVNGRINNDHPGLPPGECDVHPRFPLSAG